MVSAKYWRLRPLHGSDLSATARIAEANPATSRCLVAILMYTIRALRFLRFGEHWWGTPMSPFPESNRSFDYRAMPA